MTIKVDKNTSISIVTPKTYIDWVYSSSKPTSETLTQLTGDELTITTTANATTIDYSTSRYDNTLDATASSRVNKIIGGTGSDVILGSKLSSTLIANSVAGVGSMILPTTAEIIGGIGNDTITGGAGNDNIAGGLGSNVLTGGLGADLFVVSGYDTVTDLGIGDNLYVAAKGTVTATLVGDFIATAISGNDGTATLINKGGFNVDLSKAVGSHNFIINASKSINSIKIIGSHQADSLVAGAGNDTLDGGAGADTMTGGKGSNTFYVDNVGDKVIDTSIGGGIDTVISSVSYALGANIDNLTLTGSVHLVAKGNKLNNVITANDAGDVLIAGAGNTTLSGGKGDDIIYGSTAKLSTINGGDGNDTIAGGVGVNLITGGSGNDTFIFNKGNGLTTIIDFASKADNIPSLGIDHLEINHKAFKGMLAVELNDKNFYSGILTSARDPATEFFYNTQSGKLYFDADGSFARSKPIVIEILGLYTHPKLLAEDITIF